MNLEHKLTETPVSELYQEIKDLNRKHAEALEQIDDLQSHIDYIESQVELAMRYLQDTLMGK